MAKQDTLDDLAAARALCDWMKSQEISREKQIYICLIHVAICCVDQFEKKIREKKLFTVMELLRAYIQLIEEAESAIEGE